MLHNTKQLYGDKIAALDGDIGHVKNFYFDDKTWVIRYLVADTGDWLAGRLVLLSPHAFTTRDQVEKTLHVKLRRKQIEESPSIELNRPVSRQYEIDYYKYYGWPAYWNGSGLWGVGGLPVLMPPLRENSESKLQHHHRDDKHLRSCRAVTGYSIHTTDGDIGEVSGFLIDNKSWAIPELIVETGHWYAHKQIQIPTDRITQINYEGSAVHVNLSKADIQHTAETHVAQTGEDTP